MACDVCMHVCCERVWSCVHFLYNAIAISRKSTHSPLPSTLDPSLSHRVTAGCPHPLCHGEHDLWSGWRDATPGAACCAPLGHPGANSGSHLGEKPLLDAINDTTVCVCVCVCVCVRVCMCVCVCLC